MSKASARSPIAFTVQIDGLSPGSDSISTFSNASASSSNAPLLALPASKGVSFQSSWGASSASSLHPTRSSSSPEMKERPRMDSWTDVGFVRNAIRRLSSSYPKQEEAELEEEIKLLSGPAHKRAQSQEGGIAQRSLYDRRPSLIRQRSRRQWLNLIATSALGLTLLYLGSQAILVSSDHPHGLLPAFLDRHGGPGGPPPFAMGEGQCSRPYSLPGHIAAESDAHPTHLRWLTQDSACTPQQLMAALRDSASSADAALANEPLTFPLPPQARHQVDRSLPLPWLHRQTLLLFGDHVDRSHVMEFCSIVGGQFVSISADHPASPAPFINGIDERESRHGGSTIEASRPAVCYVKRYDLTLVSVHHWGLSNRVEFEWENLYADPHFYPPVNLPDRLSHIVIPLLDTINRQTPSLITLSSGLWDLRHFHELDNVLQLDRNAPLTQDRLDWYATRLRAALANLALAFPKVPLLWSTPHHTAGHPLFPLERIEQLDREGRKAIRKLQVEQEIARGLPAKLEKAAKEALKGLQPPSSKKKKEKTSEAMSFLNLVKGRIGEKTLAHGFVIGDEDTVDRAPEAEWGSIGVDEWGKLMKGMDHLIVHPDPHIVPGGFLWGDVVLSELERNAENDKAHPPPPPPTGFGSHASHGHGHIPPPPGERPFH